MNYPLSELEHNENHRVKITQAEKRKRQRQLSKDKRIQEGKESGRDFTIYTARARSWLEFTTAEFQALADEFARIVGSPRPVAAAKRTQNKSSDSLATGAEEPVAQEEDAPKLKWRQNRVFDTPDKLLLFCLLYYKKQGKRVPGKKPLGKLTQDRLIGMFQGSEEVKGFDEFRNKLHQTNASHWLTRCLPWVKQAVQRCYHTEPERRAALRSKLLRFDLPLI
jgi:hypothetical protein